jgi:hypothetical protein
MTVLVDNNEYLVRNNFLHRGGNPRLVLEVKEFGEYVKLQLESNTETPVLGKIYNGYWCNKNGFKEVQIIFK